MRNVPTAPNRIWWQLAVFVLVSTAAVYAGLSFNERFERQMPESRAFPSTYNSHGSGYSALLELARKLDLPFRRWQSPYRLLSERKGMLVIVQPLESLSQFEVDQIIDWVKAGNQLVYLDHFFFRFERRILDAVGLDSRSAESLADARLEASGPGPEFDHVGHLIVSAETRLTGGKPLFSDSKGALISTVQIGKGRVIVGVMPGFCANRRLSGKDGWANFQFLVNILRSADGEILFDEFAHGYTSAANVFIFLGRGPVGLLCAQLLAAFAIAVLSLSQRFGATASAQPIRKLSNLEFISGMAGTYMRARAAALAWEVIFHAFKARMCRALAVSPHENDERLVEAWAKATGQMPDEMRALLEKSSARLAAPRMTEDELADMVAACDKITERSAQILATGRRIGA